MALTHDVRAIAVELPSTVTPSPRGATVAGRYVLAVLRIVVGWTFLWAFLDKVFGFGYATPEARSWLNGGSPTKGFLSSATGPFAGFYHDLAGTGVANWLFMLGLAGIGTALLLGIGMRIAGLTGAILYLMMFAVVLHRRTTRWSTTTLSAPSWWPRWHCPPPATPSAWAAGGRGCRWSGATHGSSEPAPTWGRPGHPGRQPRC
jgi:thiosulfate dehydrogenase (quinone) large subunit